MQYSKYQLDIFNWIKNGSGNAVVDAKAGSGKTSTLVKAMDFIEPGSKILFLAYNKAIAEELRSRIPSHIDVKTLHSLGWGIINKYQKGAKLENKKTYAHIKQYFDNNKIVIKNFGDRIKISNNIRKLIEYYRYSITDNPSEDLINQIISKFDITVLGEEQKYSIPIYESFLNDQSCYDFADMLFEPVYRNMNFPKYDWVFLDEVQDVSGIQKEMFLRCMHPESRFLAAGDPFQCLYSWRGASKTVFKELQEIPNTTTLPLSISYRCGKKIIEHAQKLVPTIEHFNKNPDGEVILNGSINNVKYGDVVLCRTNAPLAALANKLLQEHKKVTIVGNDFAEHLQDIIDSSKKITCDQLFIFLNEKANKILKKIVDANNCVDPQEDPDYVNFIDKVTTIKMLAFDCKTVVELTEKIKKIFSALPDSSGITLSTVHRFKGKEADHIYIAEPHLIPFPYYLTSPEAVDNEKNVDYVARTRAKLKLEYITDWSYETARNSAQPAKTPATNDPKDNAIIVPRDAGVVHVKNKLKKNKRDKHKFSFKNR